MFKVVFWFLNVYGTDGMEPAANLVFTISRRKKSMRACNGIQCPNEVVLFLIDCIELDWEWKISGNILKDALLDCQTYRIYQLLTSSYIGISTLRLLYVKKRRNALKIEESMGMPQIIRNTQKKSLTEIETVIGGTCVELADWRVIILKKKIKGDRQASIIDVLSLEII